MQYQLSDIFIGNFKISQRFGLNPSRYAKYGYRGHNGVDFSMPVGTQIVSASDGWIREAGFDPNGFGHYVKVVHDGYFTLYAHLSQIVVSVNQRVLAGQLIGLSGNSGWSTGPHLHFGVAPCDIQGKKLELANGYGGYIDPLSSRVRWQLRNLATPVVPAPPTPQPGENGDELRALTVLYDGIQTLHDGSGNKFGNLEGMTRALIDNYKKNTGQ